MDDLYAEIDVVVLPQDRSPGAQAQLPAKLLDAMRFGKPILASPTAAIVEAAADTVLYVGDWSSLEEGRSQGLTGSRRRIGSRRSRVDTFRAAVGIRGPGWCSMRVRPQHRGSP